MEGVIGNQAACFAEASRGSSLTANLSWGNGDVHINPFILNGSEIISTINVQTPFRKSGIFLNNSRHLQINCNATDNMGIGLRFQADCEHNPHDIAENTLLQTRFGLALNYSGTWGRIGSVVGTPDLCNNNHFTGPFNNPTHYRTYNYTLTGGAAFVPTFFYRPMDASSYEPNPNGNNIGPPALSVQTQEADYNSQLENCAIYIPITGEGGGNEDGYTGIAEGDIVYPAFDEVAQWLDEKALYYKLSEDTTFMQDNPVMQQFLADQYGEEMALLWQFDEFSQQAADSLLLNDTALMSFYINEALEANYEIDNQRTYAANERDMNALIARAATTGFDVVSDSEWTWVSLLAASCPYINGSGVYKARAFYAVKDPSVYYDDQMVCNNQGYFKNDFTEEELFGEPKNQMHVCLPPILSYNLATSSVVVAYNRPSKETNLLVLRSLLGQQVASYIIPLGTVSYSIQLPQLSNSIYVVELQRQSDVFLAKIIPVIK